MADFLQSVRERVVVVETNRRWAGQSLELEVEVVAIHGPEVPSRADGGTEGHTPDPGSGGREDRHALSSQELADLVFIADLLDPHAKARGIAG